MFLWRAFVLWRQATSPEGSLAQAIRLYKYSISYLTLLFAAVAIDSLAVRHAQLSAGRGGPMRGPGSTARRGARGAASAPRP